MESKALLNLGVKYYLGDGVEQNFDTALKYFREAEALNDPQALVAIGNCYYLGDGVEKNMDIALDYYHRYYTATGKIPLTQKNNINFTIYVRLMSKK